LKGDRRLRGDCHVSRIRRKGRLRLRSSRTRVLFMGEEAERGAVHASPTHAQKAHEWGTWYPALGFSPCFGGILVDHRFWDWASNWQ
jgi:hypothetical protein